MSLFTDNSVAYGDELLDTNVNVFLFFALPCNDTLYKEHTSLMDDVTTDVSSSFSDGSTTIGSSFADSNTTISSSFTDNTKDVDDNFTKETFNG